MKGDVIRIFFMIALLAGIGWLVYPYIKKIVSPFSQQEFFREQESFRQTAPADGGCGDLTLSPFTTGMIAMWSGSVTSIPSGWVLCDGTNGTPDLRGRFVLGFNPGSATAAGFSVNTMKATGGQERVVLTEAQMPSHTHNYTEGGEYRVCSACSGHAVGDHPWDRLVWKLTDFAGNNESHNNLPPYYVLAYVMKT